MTDARARVRSERECGSRLRTATRAAAALLASLAPLAGHAGDARAGRAKAAACAVCHGELGLSQQPDAPKLAGQPEVVRLRAAQGLPERQADP
jgi:cytochrome c553